MKEIKKIVLFLAFCLIYNFSYSQIFKTKSEIIAVLGNDYDEDYLEDGRYYMSYTSEIPARAFYFSDYEGKPLVCTSFKIIYYREAINEIMSDFKKNLVELEYMKFKDYDSHILYTVHTDDKFCIVDATFDVLE